MFNRFEEIKAWQKSKELSLMIYKIFKDSKDFSFRDQIQRASISVMNNIAEGFERNTSKEFIYFLYVSKGSCGEIRSMLYLAQELKMITQNEFETMHKLSEEISKMISALIKSIK